MGIKDYCGKRENEIKYMTKVKYFKFLGQQ